MSTGEVPTRVARRRLDEVPGWDDLAAECSLYSSAAWVAHGDAHPDTSAEHLVALDAHGTPVGALPAYRLGERPPAYYSPAEVTGLTDAHDPSAGTLLGGTRLGYTGQLLVPTATTRRGDVVQALWDAFRDRADGPYGGALLYADDATVESLEPALGPDDHVVLVDAAARLALPGDVDAWRQRFSRSRRESFRREQRRYVDAGCETRVVPLAEHLEEMGALAAQVSQRYGHDRTTADEVDKLGHQLERLGTCLVLAAFVDDTMVGFTQFFPWGDTLHGRGHGVDDAWGRRASVYLNLTFYEAIAWAIEHGYREIDLGCDSLEAKVNRGCLLHPLWAVVSGPAWTSRRHELDVAQQRRLAEFEAVHESVRTPLVDRLVQRVRS